MSKWMLCPSAHAEAERAGLVYRCDGRPNHRCDGERTAFKWKARDNEGHKYESEIPCCSSCLSDQEQGYGAYGLVDEACCCAHAEESRIRALRMP